MKKTKFWVTPEVHFTLSQDKSDDTKNTNDKKMIQLGNTPRTPQYLLRSMH